MNTLRFSLAKLLGAVVLVALGLAALVNATPVWAAISSTAVILMLLVAVIGTVYRRGARRAFWLGFAVFGWTCLALSYGLLLNSERWQGLGISGVLSLVRPAVTRHSQPPLVDSEGAVVVWDHADGSLRIDGPPIDRDRLMPELQDHLQRRGSTEVVLIVDPELGGGRPILTLLRQVREDGITFRKSVYSIVTPSEKDFDQVGTVLFSVFTALLGGLIARYFYATRELAS